MISRQISDGDVRALPRVIYSRALMGEEEQCGVGGGGGGWHDNLQQAGDLVAMATDGG